MQKLRILGIAPYEAMKTALQKIAAERNDIDLDVYASDLNYGVEIVRRNLQNNYDVIISRGGTAEMIGKMTNIPIKNGIKFSSKKEAKEQFFNSFYNITGAMGGLQDSINQISLSAFPVMIIGI